MLSLYTGEAEMADSPYYKFSEYLKDRYGCRVFKIPVAVPCTCPNRDGSKGTGGCIFCGEEAAGFESLDPDIPVREQLIRNIGYMGVKYNAVKFIAYFQNYSNTYMNFDRFKSYMEEACLQDIVAVYVSTRPDCIDERHASFLSEFSSGQELDIVVEMGLQSADDESLLKLNRGHTVKDFSDSAELLGEYGIPFCAHVINDLPFESGDQARKNALFLNETGASQVKCHSLYVLKDTVLGRMYKNNEIEMLRCSDFIDRTISFLRNLNKGIVVQRLIGRAPEERTLFCNFGRNWRSVLDEITDLMNKNGWRQGDLT